MERHKNKKTSRTIMSNAKTLFWKFGISRVTVEEICKEAGVSKMTFYRYFDNKLELAAAVLSEIWDQSMAEYNEIMSQDIDYAEKIKKMVLMKHDSTNELSKELLKDIYQKEELGLKSVLEDYSRKMMGQMMDDFSEAQQNGWIRKGIKIEFLFYFLNHLNGLFMDEKLLSMYDNSQDAIMELTNMFFYGVIQNEEIK